MATTTMLWFRKGLRLHDNPALTAAVEGSSRLLPVFCLDPWFVSSGRVGANRLHFLLQSLCDLDSSLRALDSQLIVLRGSPEVELPRAMKAWKVQRLVFEVDTEEYAKARDAKIMALAQAQGVDVTTSWGHTLTNLDELLRRHPGGKPTTTYSAFLGHLEKQMRAAPLTVLDKPPRLPPARDSESGAWLAEAGAVDGVPTPEELGLAAQSSAVILRGGESEALARMEANLARPEWIAAFEKPATSPTELDLHGPKTRSTTALSPYLKFGCLSARLLHERVAKVYAVHTKHAKPPTSLHGQIYWREFYYCCAHGTPNFERMVGNPICRQIPWDSDPNLLAAWREARTGYPWIDAVTTPPQHSTRPLHPSTPHWQRSILRPPDATGLASRSLPKRQGAQQTATPDASIRPRRLACRLRSPLSLAESRRIAASLW